MKRIHNYCIYSIFSVLLLIGSLRVISFASVNYLGIENKLFLYFNDKVVINDNKTIENDDEQTIITSIERKWNDMFIFLESFCSTSLPCAQYAKEVTEVIYEDVLHNSFHKNSGKYGMIETATEASNYISDFLQYLEERVNYIYINTPYSDNIYYYEGKTEEIENWNTVCGNEIFWDKLNEKDYNCMKLYDYLGEDYKYEYDSTNHWMPQNALDASKCLAEQLNENYNLEISTDAFEKEKYYDICSDKREFTAEIKKKYGYNFKFGVPFEEGNYTLKWGNTEISGTWSEVFVNDSNEWRVQDAAYHNLSRIANGGGIKYLKNNESKTGKKMIMIGDSFCWLVYAYMIQEFDEIIAIWNCEDYEIRDLIEQNDPNVVVIMLNDCQLSKNGIAKNFQFR